MTQAVIIIFMECVCLLRWGELDAVLVGVELGPQEAISHQQWSSQPRAPSCAGGALGVSAGYLW